MEQVDYDAYVEAFEEYAKQVGLTNPAYDGPHDLQIKSKKWLHEPVPKSPFDVDKIRKALGCIPVVCSIKVTRGELTSGDPLGGVITVRHTMKAHKRTYELEPWAVTYEPSKWDWFENGGPYKHVINVPETNQQIQIDPYMLKHLEDSESFLQHIIKRFKHEWMEHQIHHG